MKMDETGLSLDYVLFLLTSITVHIARRSLLIDLPRCQCRTSNFEIRPFSIMRINVRSVQFCFCFEFLNEGIRLVYNRKNHTSISN